MFETGFWPFYWVSSGGWWLYRLMYPHRFSGSKRKYLIWLNMLGFVNMNKFLSFFPVMAATPTSLYVKFGFWLVPFSLIFFYNIYDVNCISKMWTPKCNYNKLTRWPVRVHWHFSALCGHIHISSLLLLHPGCTGMQWTWTVSYTHLTLPTILRV